MPLTSSANVNKEKLIRKAVLENVYTQCFQRIRQSLLLLFITISFWYPWEAIQISSFFQAKVSVRNTSRCFQVVMVIAAALWHVHMACMAGAIFHANAKSAAKTRGEAARGISIWFFFLAASPVVFAVPRTSFPPSHQQYRLVCTHGDLFWKLR